MRPSDEVSVRSRTEAVTTRVPWGEVITISAARWVMGIEGGVTIRLGCEGSVYRRWGSFWRPQRRWGSILRPLWWRDDIGGLLEAEAAGWQLL